MDGTWSLSLTVHVGAIMSYGSRLRIRTMGTWIPRWRDEVNKWRFTLRYHVRGGGQEPGGRWEGVSLNGNGAEKILSCQKFHWYMARRSRRKYGSARVWNAEYPQRNAVHIKILNLREVVQNALHELVSLSYNHGFTLDIQLSDLCLLHSCPAAASYLALPLQKPQRATHTIPSDHQSVSKCLLLIPSHQENKEEPSKNEI